MERPLVLVLGAPRSGTTWLQRVLAAHPEVASAQETDLIDRYLAPSWYAWQASLESDSERWRQARHKGLPAVVTFEEFRDILLTTADRVYERILALKPGASVVVDKNPGYAMHPAVISALFPTSKVIHVLRDGRDVVDSLLAAGRGWAASWAPSDVASGAEMWARHVRHAMQLAGHPGGYLEVRYEELRRTERPQWQRVFDFAGVSVTSEFLEATLAEAAVGRSATTDSLVWGGEVARRVGARPSEPLGFIREGRVGQWTQWPGYEQWLFSRVAGDLLVELGYSGDVAASGLAGRLYKIRHARQRGGTLARRVGAALSKFRHGRAA